MASDAAIEYAVPADLPFLSRCDRHGADLPEKVGRREVLIARLDAAAVGTLRFGYFWDTIPFMHLLWVVEAYRSRGVGTAIVRFWEAEMARLGHRQVLTSTQADETAQHFYRKLGYADVGAFVLPGEPTELILRKDLAQS